MSTDIGFALNYQHIFEVNVTPTADSATWAWVGPGIKTITPDTSETSNDDAYYSSEGNTETTVTGLTKKYSVEGDRKYSDPFQDYVASIEELVGEDRKTQYRITNPNGKIIQAECTIADIKAEGPNGDANSKTGFSCSIARNGACTVVQDATGNVLPETVTASAVSVAKGKTASVSATVTPSAASSRCLFAVEDDSIATVSTDGVVTGVAAGKTKVAVKCAAKPSISCTVEVTVTA